VNVFPVEQQEQIRIMLSVSICAIISQLLIRRVDKPGRLAAFEIMVATPSIQNLIREKKTYRIQSDIQTGGKWGMITMDSYLINLYKEGKISFEDVMLWCYDQDQTKATMVAEGIITQTMADAFSRREGVPTIAEQQAKEKQTTNGRRTQAPGRVAP